ncbi:MAG: hypothetical protein ACFE9R_21245 [Candidatus Hermodarchaeota archaeon]
MRSTKTKVIYGVVIVVCISLGTFLLLWGTWLLLDPPILTGFDIFSGYYSYVPEEYNNFIMVLWIPGLFLLLFGIILARTRAKLNK